MNARRALEFQGLSAIVTGGASGIGLAVAETLAASGAGIAVLDLSPEQAPGHLHAIQADVADTAAVADATAQAVEYLGGLDVLVNNAGIGAQGTVEDNSEEEWHHVLDVNVLGIVRTTRAALPHLRRSAHPAIVNVCSVTATTGLPQRALYSASKGAVLALTLAMAADHLYEGIRVNCVNPGTVDTPWVGRLIAAADDPGAERRALEARQPSGRLVTAQQVASAVAYLAGPSAGATTGTALAVDGGISGLLVRPSASLRPEAPAHREP
ncbi:SDR family oxidoreductase [Kitasatospora atroaurantiaca]|uniref:NAD(P)-dependent dehydrogenase (Short-subunit alcohol dehydrogenase family) n=1 Tax=Kitasatospora atroaurantiaca TaxID=285545 RepID=A0A561F0Z8_9ACTN|nr:SDR family oxidoreductase [Kitasatospora atroaurantiaca]TWE21543.1 NAD(P)-dependent dehydrogenase (short-subunit alcohol dehydrogenase family) [Kitasatospora atroaurantiaca]